MGDDRRPGGRKRNVVGKIERSAEWVKKDQLQHPGTTVGWLWTTLKKSGRKAIFGAGPVCVATDMFVLCVCPDVPEYWFVLRNGQFYQVECGPGGHGPTMCANPANMNRAERYIWADALAREFMDLVTNDNEQRAIQPMVARYHMMVLAHVNGKMVDLATVSIERGVRDFARSIDRTWDYEELTRPRFPSIKHALYTSLVLSLSADDASMLIEYAAFLEIRLPVVTRESAYLIHAQAVRMLAHLVPTWWVQGAGTDWDMLGTDIATIFRLQHVRMANDVVDRDVPMDALIGMRRAITELGESPFVSRYLSRMQVVQHELEEKEKPDA